MSKKINQVLGFLIPILLFIPYIFFSPIKFNYTGLINDTDAKLLSSFCILPSMLFLTYLFYNKKPVYIKQKKWLIYNLFLLVLMLMTFFTPYNKSEPVTSNIHLFFGVISFYIMILEYIAIFYLDSHNRNIICILFLLDFIYITTCMSVNGLSEWIFITIISISLITKKN